MAALTQTEKIGILVGAGAITATAAILASRTGSGPPPPPPNGWKVPLVGLLDRDGPPAYPWMLGQVCNVRWDQLQSGPGTAILPNNPIDTAVAQVRAFNAANNVNRGIRVRLFMGSKSPVGNAVSWPQSLGGAPITVTGDQGQSGSVGHYWTSPFQSAYTGLITGLHLKYDGVAEVREITCAGAMLLYAEEYLKYDASQLTNAGDTLTLEVASYGAALNAMQQLTSCRTTRSFNPATFPSIGGITFTIAQLKAFRAAMPHGVMMNNSIRATSLGADYDQMYAMMKSLGGLISFQTAVFARMGDPATTLAACVGYGACSVELWSGYGPGGSSSVEEAILQQYQGLLVANLPAGV